MTIKNFLPELIAFLLGISAVYFLKWTTTDLVWSLWLSSLVIGYLTILSIIVAGVYFGLHVIYHSDFPEKDRLKAILIGGSMALFLLGFFSLHFCGFHSGHAVFLISFFPLKEISGGPFGDSFGNPFKLWKIVFQYMMPLYGFFLIAPIIMERKNIFGPLMDAIRLVREGIKGDLIKTYPNTPDTKKRALQDPFARPYVNVIKMHGLIFFFGFCHWLKVDSFVVYVVVYSVYFFPWRILSRKKENPAPVVT